MVKPKPLEPWQAEDAERLRAAFDKHAGVSQARFGADHEIGNQSMVSQYLLGRRPLNIDAARRFAKGLGVQIADFSPTLAERISEASAHAGAPDSGGEYIEINQYEVQFAAGTGTLAFEANPRNKLAFRRSFLRSERVRPANAIVVYARGDSMEPVIPDRAALLIDRGAHVLEDGNNGKIFGFRLDGELLVKRLERLDDGSICAHSINPSYKAIHLDGRKDFEIIGRVVWMGTRL